MENIGFRGHHACLRNGNLADAGHQAGPGENGSCQDHFLEKSDYLMHDLLWGGPVAIASSFKELSPNGVIGAPTLASGKRGEALLESIVDAVAGFVREFAQWPPETKQENDE